MSELVKRLLDFGANALTADELAKASDELSAILEQRSERERTLAIGRQLGAQAMRERGEKYISQWKAEAIAVLRANPGSSMSDVARKVCERCQEKGLTKPDGAPHSEGRIYNVLRQIRPDLEKESGIRRNLA